MCAICLPCCIEQVKDDGDGIEENDRLYVAKRHYTSKLATLDDLDTISSYGFRGEALNSMCAVSDHVIIMTKTRADVIGKQYDLSREGTISKYAFAEITHARKSLNYLSLVKSQQIRYQNQALW